MRHVVVHAFIHERDMEKMSAQGDRIDKDAVCVQFILSGQKVMLTFYD